MQPRFEMWFGVCAFCALFLTACMAQGLTTPEQSVQSEIRLVLSANQVSGQSRALEFVAEITGGADNEPSLYCQATTWDFGDGPPLTMTPSCAPYSPDVRITRRLVMKHTYSASGTYNVTLTYGPLRAQTTVQVP